MTVVANVVSYNDTIAILISRAHHVNLKTLSTFTQLLCLIFIFVHLGAVINRMHCVNMPAHWVQGVVVARVRDLVFVPARHLFES